MSEFGQAFAQARAQGQQIFEFQGKLFTTQTAEEANAPIQGPAVPPPVPDPTGGVNRSSLVSPVPDENMQVQRQYPGAAQQSLQQSPTGQAMASMAAQPQSLWAGMKANAADILAGHEGAIAEGIPQFANVQQSFRDADVAGKAAGLDLEARDVERHKAGSRNSTLDNGFFATLLGSQGHEANTLMGTGRQIMSGKPFDKTSITGQALTAGRFASESMQDVVNNLFGQAEALLVQLGLGTRESPVNLGEMQVDAPGTKSQAVGSVVERGVNSLAELVGVFQQKLAETKRSIPDAESQTQQVARAGGNSVVGQQSAS